MIELTEIEGILGQEHLFVSGIVTPKSSDDLPNGTQSVLLVSPDEPAFWPYFTASSEYRDGLPDPMNRWSTSAMTRVTPQIKGSIALFPFGGPPWLPFIQWARRSTRSYSSPVGLLVHDKAGMFISFRAALALPFHVDGPSLPTHGPCETCHSPCLTACPVDAFATGSYDVPTCKAHLRTKEGIACRDGCLVRRACPIGQDLRLPAQSAFHMEAFCPDFA